jgi:hypothetical protein
LFEIGGDFNYFEKINFINSDVSKRYLLPSLIKVLIKTEQS